MKKLLITFALLAILTTSALAHAECKITILHFNDFNGQMDIPKKDLGGAAKIGATIGKIYNDNELDGRKTIILAGGNMISGSAISDKYKGAVDMEFLKQIGTAAMVIGEGDFAYGGKRLKELMTKGGFPILSANILDNKTTPLYASATLVLPLEAGCRVGIMGLTGKLKNAGDLQIKDPIQYAENYLEDMKEQSDVRIALSHIGQAKDAEIAKNVKGFTAILGGGDNVSPGKYCTEISGVPVCQTPPNGQFIGRLDITVTGGKAIVEKYELIPVNKKAGRLKDMEAMIESAKAGNFN